MGKRAVATVLTALLWVGGLVAQDRSSCDRYVERGVRPGMSPREVWNALDGRGDSESEIDGPSGRVLRVRYTDSEPQVEVEYDRPDISKSRGVVTLVRTTVPSSRVGGLLERFGEPLRGRDAIRAGLADGDAVWVDERCGVAVRAWYEAPPWWDPTRGGYRLEVRDLTGAIAAGLVEPAAAATAAAATTATEAGTEPPVAPVETRRTAVNASATRIPVVGVDDVTAPTRIETSYVPPFYPRAAFAAGVEGVVDIQVRLGASGDVLDILSVEARPAGRGFEDAAVAAIRKWRYRPALRDGEPVEVILPITVEFRARR